ncbi:site-specific integrase [Paraburkholderia tropica]|uniref:tyrosine-type recombinase/integrase n=1 Tax=Paraburkholderia tropica TaxID=92647 RepID=UPI001600D862|nr:site-specific integrase [Paraburkholderia tropica]QNB13447.1 site-specific integrase [Paraburkholderia tropica]
MAASYQLFRVGQIWHYRFQIDGTRVQRSTRESVKYRADEIAARAYDHAKLWARGQEPVPTLRELFIQWIAAHEPIVSGAHIKSISTVGRLHLYGLGDVSIASLTTGMVECARLEHLETHSRASVNHWLKSIQLVCNWAVRRGVIPRVPWQVKTLKVQKRPRAILPVSAAAAWLGALDDIAGRHIGVRIAVRLMLGAGLRESETRTARWEWMDWERRTYTPGITKGREADPVPLPPWLIEYLSPLRRTEGLMVVSPSGRACGAGFTRNQIHATNARCGTPGLTPHRLRGTFATQLSEQGVPIQTIKRVMRHKDVRTTMFYLEANLGAVADAQVRLGEKMGLGENATQIERRKSGEASR